MGGSSHEDYLLRQVKAMAAILARILGLRTNGEMEEARLELDRAYGLLLGSRSDLLRKVDPQTAATLLASPDAILALAQLTSEEAAQDGEADRCAELRVRAVELGIEAAQRDNGNRAIRDFLAGLAPMVDCQQLTLQQREILADSFGPQANAPDEVGTSES